MLGTSQKPQFCPGIHWSYTNTGYLMLGSIIIENTEGAPFAEVLSKPPLQPLSLTHTSMRRLSIELPVTSGRDTRRPVYAPEQYVPPTLSAGWLLRRATGFVFGMRR